MGNAAAFSLPGSSDSSHDLVAPGPASASALTYGLTKTNANGQASFTVSSTQAGTATYTVATSNDVHGTFNYQSSPLSITFGSKAKTTATGLVVSPGTSTAKAAAAVALDGAAEGTTVTVSLKDKDGAPVAGKVVALTARAGLHPITVAPVSARTAPPAWPASPWTRGRHRLVGFAAIDETDFARGGATCAGELRRPIYARPDRLEGVCQPDRAGARRRDRFCHRHRHAAQWCRGAGRGSAG